MPGRRRRGAIQERVPRRLLGSPRPVAGRAGVRQRARRPPHGAAASRRSRTRSPTRAIARWAAETADRHRSAAIAAAVDAADAAEADQASGEPGSGIREIARAALRRHVHESRRSGDRPGRDRRAERGRHHDARRAECVLRPAADFAGTSARKRAGWRRPTSTRSTTRPHRGHAIVFVEPSCLSAVREDAPDLLRGELQRRARVVAQHVGAVRGVPRGANAPAAARRCRSKPGPAEVLLHPHCHQRSMGLAAPAKALLSRIPSATVTDLDAGCCGMAGSFGYTRDHYDVSRAIAERKLLPAARAHDARLGAGRRRARPAATRSPISPASRAVHPGRAACESLLRPGKGHR